MTAKQIFEEFKTGCLWFSENPKHLGECNQSVKCSIATCPRLFQYRKKEGK